MGMGVFESIVWHVTEHGATQSLIWAYVLLAVVAWFGLQLRQEIREHGLTDDVRDRWIRRTLMLLFYVFLRIAQP